MTPVPTKWLGAVVRELREERGWSRNELAAQADVHPLTVLRIELNQRLANVATVQALLLALDHELEVVPANGIGPRRG